MAENTKIQWATHTFNPWRGCSKVAAGCANCYAETQSKRNPATLGVWGPHGTRVVASESMWREPLKWDRAADAERLRIGNCSHCAERDHGGCEYCGGPFERPRVFCASLADVFECWVNEMRDSRRGVLHVCEEGHWSFVTSVYARGHECLHCDGLARVATIGDVRARLFELIDATPNIDWLLLTKRIANARRMVLSQHLDGGTTGVIREWMADGESQDVHPYWRRNLWLGVSVACRADLRQLDELRACRDLCAKTFVSAEPLIEDLGEVDLTGVDWVIVGGESGPNARPCDIAWIRSIVRQCRDAGVPCFVKQLGANPTEYIVTAVGQDEYGNVDDNGRQEALRLRDRKGGDPDEWPKDIRVREVPS